MSWWEYGVPGLNAYRIAQNLTEGGAGESAEETRGLLHGQGQAASDFADTGQRGFGMTGGELDGDRNRLRQLAMGHNSLSAEQLRQGLQQNVAGQQAMAASARPGMAGMGARSAMMNAGRMGQGLAGQQAMAGIAERNAAAQTLGQLTLGQRGQDLQAALGSRNNAVSAYGGGPPTQSAWDRYGGMIQGGLQSAFMFSDERLKTDIAPGDDDAAEFIKGLKAYRYKYKDKKNGAGEQLGVMAQDLETTRLGKQAVIDTPEGKVVHGAKLAGAIAATLPGIAKRLAKLEGRSK